MIEIGLDSIIKIHTDYEARKQIAREHELKTFGKVDEKRVSYLAFEALRPLVGRVRELEAELEVYREEKRLEWERYQDEC